MPAFLNCEPVGDCFQYGFELPNSPDKDAIKVGDELAVESVYDETSSCFLSRVEREEWRVFWMGCKIFEKLIADERFVDGCQSLIAVPIC